MADFIFSPAQTPDLQQLAPLFAHILGPSKARPTVSLGAVKRADAEAWLRKQHERYAASINAGGRQRSGLIANLDIVNRVELVDLKEEA